MTTGTPARDHLRHCATTGQWDAAAADTLMSSLPDPDQLLTRDYLDLRLRAEFADLRREMFGEMNALEVRVGGEMGALRTDLTGEMGALRTDLTGEMNARDVVLRGEMGALRTDLVGEMNARDVMLRGEMGALRTDLVGEMGALRTDLVEAMRTHAVSQTRWVVGALLGSIFAFGSLLVAAITVLN